MEFFVFFFFFGIVFRESPTTHLQLKMWKSIELLNSSTDKCFFYELLLLSAIDEPWGIRNHRINEWLMMLTILLMLTTTNSMSSHQKLKDYQKDYLLLKYIHSMSRCDNSTFVNSFFSADSIKLLLFFCFITEMEGLVRTKKKRKKKEF